MKAKRFLGLAAGVATASVLAGLYKYGGSRTFFPKRPQSTLEQLEYDWNKPNGRFGDIPQRLYGPDDPRDWPKKNLDLDAKMRAWPGDSLVTYDNWSEKLHVMYMVITELGFWDEFKNDPATNRPYTHCEGAHIKEVAEHPAVKASGHSEYSLNLAINQMQEVAKTDWRSFCKRFELITDESITDESITAKNI